MRKVGNLMTCKKASAILLITLIVALSAHSVFAESPQEALNRYISELKNNPNDNALREKIIKHVRSMKPAPAVPEDAERFLARGKTAFSMAKSAEDFASAVAEFKQAVDAAPWLANGYYNLGHAQESAENFADAIQSFKFYLIADPSAKDAPAVKSRIYGMEYKLEQKAKAQSFVDKCIDLDHAGRTADAVSECKEAVRLNPKDANARYNLGSVLRRQYGSSTPEITRGCREAIPELEEAIRLGDSYILRAYSNLGLCYNYLGQYQKAIDIMEKGLSAFPYEDDQNGFLHAQLGYAYSSVGKYEKAITNYEKAIALGDSESSLLRENIENCKRKLGR